MSLPKHSEVKNAIINHPNFNKDLMYFDHVFIQNYKTLRENVEKNPEQPLKVYRQNTMVYNVEEGNPYVIFFRNAIPVRTMNKVFKILDNWYTDKMDAVHFGVWGKYVSLLYNITEGQQGNNPIIEEKLRNKTDLYERGEKLLHMWLPLLGIHLENVREQLGINKSFAGFPAMAINRCRAGTRAADLHYDSEDSGLSMLYCCGDFKGAHLRFPDLGFELDFSPGDVVFFKDNILQHGITAFKGNRYSVVFFMHRTLDYPNNRPYYNLRRGETETEYIKQGCPPVFPTKIKGKRMNTRRKKKDEGDEKQENKDKKEEEEGNKKRKKKKGNEKKVKASKKKSTTESSNCKKVKLQ